MRPIVLTALQLLFCGACVAQPVPIAVAPPSSTPPASTATASPTPPVSIAVTNVTARATRTAVPSDFHYVVGWARVLLLDTTNRTASEVASFEARSSEPGYPSAEISASLDGRTALLTVHVTPFDASVFILSPESGGVRTLLRGAVVRTVLSPDGTRFAVGRIDPDSTIAGLWAGTLAGPSARRLIADDPQYGGGPPIPYAFSPNGELLAFGLRNGDAGAHAGIIAYDSPEARTDRGSGDWIIHGGNVTLLGPSSGAQFVDDGELFVWSSRDAFGGQTIAYTYQLNAKRTTRLYQPPLGDTIMSPAAWSPGARGFAEAERPICCGVNLSETVKTIFEDGRVATYANRGALIDLWWSGTGPNARLYGIAGGDDSNGAVADLVSGAVVMQFCWRGGTPPGCN